MIDLNFLSKHNYRAKTGYKSVDFYKKVALFIILYKSFLFIMLDYSYYSSIPFDNLFVMLEYFNFQALYCTTYL